MTNAELIQKIRAEIERRIKELQRIISEHIGEDCLFTKGSIDAYNGLLSFLSTLESEKPVPADLEEAAKNHIRKVVDAAGHPGWDWTTQDIADAFKAGAEWAMDQLPKWRESSKEYYTDKPKVYEGFGQFKLFWKDRVIDLNKVFETLPKK